MTDYLEIDVSLPTAPEMLRLGRALKASRVQLLGHLMALWCWTWIHAPDGNLAEFSDEDIAAAAEWSTGDNFAEALRQAGFLTVDGRVIGWSRYAKLLRTKAAAAKRQHAARERDGGVTGALLQRDSSVTAALRVRDGCVTEALRQRDGSVTPALLERDNSQSQSQSQKKKSPRTSPAGEGGPGPSRELRDWLAQTWADAHDGKQPTWSKRDWVQLARLHRQQGEAEIRGRWPAYLDDAEKFYAGHPLTKFCSHFDRWTPKTDRAPPMQDWPPEKVRDSLRWALDTNNTERVRAFGRYAAHLMKHNADWAGELRGELDELIQRAREYLSK